MLTNQLKVMIQRVIMGGRIPKKILLSQALFDSLRMENTHLTVYKAPPNTKASFAGIEVAIVPDITQPIIELGDDSL